MKKFIYKTIIIAAPILILPLSIIILYGFPPPKLSTSISFNAKILYIKEKQFSDGIDIMAVGSSMSLNNIHSSTIQNYFGHKYVNISSWGQNMEEDFELIKIFTKYYNPKIILISSGYMDFNNNSKAIKYNLVENYLFGNEMLAYKELNLRYLWKESRSFSNKKKDIYNYTSLKYDDYGGINLKKNNFIIKKNRWVGNNVNEFNLDKLQYRYLDSISLLCETKGINLVFIQSPYRVGYYSRLDDKSLDILTNHEIKVDSVLKKSHQLFIKAENGIWKDNLFLDYSHFNNEGAKKYTEYFIERIINYQLTKHQT